MSPIAMPLPAKGGGRPFFVLLLLMVQAGGAIFFVFDGFSELLSNPTSLHPLTEAPIALALVCGVFFTGMEMRRTLRRVAEKDLALGQAQVVFGQVVRAQFTSWGLTPAECDVALLALKGRDVADIAELRSAAPGTVRAQLTRIYAKAGVSGRAQFAAFFVEGLLAEKR